MPQAASLPELLVQLPLDYWLLISAGVIGVVGTASLSKYLTLRGGGQAIAEALGGGLVSRTDPDPSKQRLLNVVEEMAIASGASGVSDP